MSDEEKRRLIELVMKYSAATLLQDILDFDEGERDLQDLESS
jgi:hypothetical protein